VTLELWEVMTKEVEAADAFTITAGCDKHFKTCKAKFDNSVNFRGFPHVSGIDFALAVPDRGGKKRRRENELTALARGHRKAADFGGDVGMARG
jgi:uncharacterized phage protein (TIGR02218 family)